MKLQMYPMPLMTLVARLGPDLGDRDTIIVVNTLWLKKTVLLHSQNNDIRWPVVIKRKKSGILFTGLSPAAEMICHVYSLGPLNYPIIDSLPQTDLLSLYQMSINVDLIRGRALWLSYVLFYKHSSMWSVENYFSSLYACQVVGTHFIFRLNYVKRK